jgi:hypothetical protein
MMMRDHTVFAVVLLVFAIGFYSFTSVSPTGQAYGVYSVGELYDGPVTTAAGNHFWSDNNPQPLGNPLRVKSLFEGEVNEERGTIQLCVERALQYLHRATFEEAKYQFRRTSVCMGVNPENLDIDGDGFLTREDIEISEAYYSLSGITKIQKNELNELLPCSASNEGRRIFLSGEYKTCINLRNSPGYKFLNWDMFGYV